MGVYMFSYNHMIIGNIENATRKKLCTGCGTCSSICPQGAIKIEVDHSKGIYLPRLDKELCNDCGICIDICPGCEVDFHYLNSHFFDNGEVDPLLGSYRNCYVGQAVNHEIRYNSSSGGLVTALLNFALKEGIIDGVLVAKMSESNPLRPYPFIARTEDEITSAACSKYCPVPANIALREIIDSKGFYAVVGLPCHIHGLRKVCMRYESLAKKIRLTFGLFCSHVNSFNGTEYLFKQLRINTKNIKEITYRGNGWPGKMVVKMKSGYEYTYEYDFYMPILHAYNFFTPARCFLCSDLTSEISDISCGDAWLPEYRKDNVGKSMIITRSEQGEDLVLRAMKRGIIELEIIGKEKVVEAQGIVFKKIYSRKKALINKGTVLFNPSTRDYLRSITQSIAQVLGKKPVFPLLKAYVKLIKTGEKIVVPKS